MPPRQFRLNTSVPSCFLAFLAIGMLACGAPDERNRTRDDDKNGDEKEELLDQCLNEEDDGWLTSIIEGEGMTGREYARAAATDCGLSCQSHPTKDECAIECMTEVFKVPLTEGCTSCYGGIVLCTIDNCLPQCIGDSQSPPCKACQASRGCDDAFYSCSGLEPED